MKKFLSVILAAIIMALPLFARFYTINSQAAEIDYKCGDNATWTLDTEGVLTVSGTGDMYDFNGVFDNPPWDKFNNSIYEIIIGEGITSIGMYAFKNCRYATKLHIASTVEVIKADSIGSDSNKSIKTITVGENSMLRTVDSYALSKTAWYGDQTYGEPVYLGRMLYILRGASGKNIEIREGTIALSEYALYNSGVAGITFPDSLEYIGYAALSSTPWEDNQPDGPMYAGNIFYKYKGELPLDEIDYIIKDGTKGIAGGAFYASSRLCSVTIPESVRTIGASAFYRCPNLETVIFEEGSELYEIGGAAFSGSNKLTELELPENIEVIGSLAFASTHITQLNLGAKARKFGRQVTENSFIKNINVDQSNPNLSSDKGVLYNKDKSVLIQIPYLSDLEKYEVDKNCEFVRSYAGGYSGLKEIKFNDGLKYIDRYAFYFSDEMSRLNIPGTIKEIGYCAFGACVSLSDVSFEYGVSKINGSAFSGCSAIKTIDIPSSVTELESYCFENCKKLEKVTIPASVSKINTTSFKNCSNITIYCDENSYAHGFAKDNSIPYVLISEMLDFDKINQTVLSANNIDRTLYTPESLAKLDAALNEVDLETEGLTQGQIDVWCDAIEKAINELRFKPADYTSVDKLKSQAESINRRLYTPRSLAELDKALAAVDYELTADKQALVAEWAKAIEKAIKNLEFLPADYSAVNTEINKAEKLDRRYYSEISLIALDAAVNAVEYGLNITRQSEVDSFAKSISDAISALEYASIVLRHELCGVIVSATAKEIKPDTVLAVEEVDPSNYEGTNFAVGGSIRSLHFYDINLVYETVIVLPDGTVTVKIKLADGVDPKKCKVYHVTEDIVNPLVRFTSAIDGNYIVFETDHFSEFAVIEVDTVVTSIEVTELPDKTVYGVGEQIDFGGMKVIAHYSDGISNEIIDYKVGMVTLNTIGTQKVTVYYTYGNITKTAEFEITVTADKCSADITENGKSVDRINKKLGLFSLYARASIQLDCDVKNADGCTLSWSSDNSKVLVDKSGKVTCKGLFGAKRANITVEVINGDGNVVARDSVSVIFYKLSFQLSNTMSQAIGVLKRNIILW